MNPETADSSETARHYRDGVTALESLAQMDLDWAAPACGTWSCADVARHLAGVAEWYHDWLDRALGGEVSPPFPLSELPTRNEFEISSRRELDGPAALQQFAGQARTYLDRALAVWTAPYGFPFGVTTVGGHAAAAASEWHIHAWDISLANELHHSPRQPESLLGALTPLWAEREGGLRRLHTRWILPITARREPWLTILRRSGRTT